MPKNTPPLYDKGLIQIRGLTLDGTPAFEIYDGRESTENPKRIVTRVKQQGIDLDPEDIAALMSGDELEAPLVREGKKDLMRLIYSTGITSSKKVVGDKTYENFHLNVRSCLVNRDPQGNNVSYTFTHPEDRKLEDVKARRSVSVYAKIGKRDNPVPISAAMANDILDGHTVTAPDRAHLSMKGIEENDKGFLEVKVSAEWIKSTEKKVVFAGAEGGEDNPFADGGAGSRKPRQVASARP